MSSADEMQAVQQSLNSVDEMVEESGQGYSNEPQEEQRPQQHVPTEAEINFKQMREEKKRIERERDELQKELRQYSQMILQSQQNQKAPQEEKFGIDPDALVEGRHLNEYEKRMRAYEKKAQEMEQQFSQYQSRINHTLTEARIKSEFPDFERVVNNQTIDKLKTRYPSIASSIGNNPDQYSQAAAAYEAIKNMGLYEDPALKVNREKVQTNMGKPRSATTLSGNASPLNNANAFANGLTPELRAQLWKEMNEAKRKA